jgi:hypothetical protein
MNHLNDNELVLALDSEMEEAELKRAVDHLAECYACRERWEKLQGLSARVMEYQQLMYPTLSAKSADKGGARVVPMRVSSFGFRVPSWGWGLVAAGVLLGVSVGLWNIDHLSNAHPIAHEQSPGDKGGAQVAVSSTGLQSDRGPSHPASEAVGDPGSRKERAQDDKSDLNGQKRTSRVSHHSHKAKSQGNGSAQQNAANQFTELPFSNAALPLDQATVVRVTLPAAALRQAGVAVNEDDANAMLQADVVLGMDGLPRGIRLVTSGNSGTTN